MEVARRFNPLSWSRRTVVFVALAFYAVFIPTYVYYGLQPAAAAEEIGEISIPSVSISSKINKVDLKDNRLETPDFTVGSYSTNENRVFLFAHSTSAFKNLENVELEDEIIYNSETFIIAKKVTLPVEKINMGNLLKDSGEKSLVLMTCAGEEKDGKFDSRLIVTAVQK